MNNERLEYAFLWFIENYSYCWHQNGEALHSPYFTVDGLEAADWRLKLYPRGKTAEDKGFISLFLMRSVEDDGPEKVSLKYELSFLTANGHTLCSDQYGFTFKRGQGRGYQKFLQMNIISLRKKADCFPEDILTVRCKMWKGEGKVHKVAPTCARTRIAFENIYFLHVVEKFSVLEPKQKKTIEIRSHSKNGRAVSSSIYFTYDSCSEGNIIVEIIPYDNNYNICRQKISLLDGSGNIIGCSETDNRFEVERKDMQVLSLTRKVILAKKHEYLPDDKLCLLCECSFSSGLEFEQSEEIQQKIHTAVVKFKRNVYEAAEKISAYPSVSKDMEALYISQGLTDVELKTETKSFPAHKNVLCARSPVFKAMMTDDMKKKYKICIQIDDLKDNIVQQLLLFLYSDNIENLHWKSAIQLYYAADKYQIRKLKAVCSCFLVENLTTSNATEFLLLAETHNDPDLKDVFGDFLLEHEEEVFKSKEWETLTETNPLLVKKAVHLKYKRRSELN